MLPLKYYDWSRKFYIDYIKLLVFKVPVNNNFLYLILKNSNSAPPGSNFFGLTLETLSCVATSVLRMRSLHVVAFSKKLRWLAQTKVISLKTQLHAVNAR